MLYDTIFMHLSVDLSMHFVKMFGGCFFILSYFFCCDHKCQCWKTHQYAIAIVCI